MIQYILVFLLNAQGNVEGVLAQAAPAEAQGNCTTYAQNASLLIGQIKPGYTSAVGRRCVSSNDLADKMHTLAVRYACVVPANKSGDALDIRRLRCAGTEVY